MLIINNLYKITSIQTWIAKIVFISLGYDRRKHYKLEARGMLTWFFAGRSIAPPAFFNLKFNMIKNYETNYRKRSRKFYPM